MTTKNEGGMTREELLAELNNPEALHRLAARQGMKVVPVQEEKDEERDLQVPGDLILDSEEPSIAEILKGFNKALKDQRDYFEKKLDARTKKVKKTVDQRDATTLAQKVEQFRSTHKHFDKLLKDVDAFYRQSGDLEGAYKKACKANDLDPEEGTEAAADKKVAKKAVADSKNKPPLSPRSSDTIGEEKETKKEFKTIKDAARASLANMIAKDPSISSIVNNEEPPEKEEAPKELSEE